jgi:inhibitor of KinA
MPDRRIGPIAIKPFGDAAILVSFGSTVDPVLAAHAQAVAAAVQSARSTAPAIGRPVPAHASVLVPFDPLAIELEDAVAVVRSVLAGINDEATRPNLEPDPDVVIEIPVRYGGADGPDLEAVAELHDLRPSDVVDLHASVRYRVLFLGFAPGFGYLAGLPRRIATPRRSSPRERVAAGSVGIAGEQTAVYPRSMPGGWQLIGRTDVVLFDPDRPEPALFRPGATVRFVPTTRP